MSLFTVDKPFNKANNEYYCDARRLQISGFLLSLLIAVFGAVIWWQAGSGVATALGIFLVVAAVFYAFVSASITRTLDKPQDLYDNNPLCAAMIAEVEPRSMTLLALVDRDKSATDSASLDILKQPALAVRTVTKIAGTPRSVGTRVPSVAVGGNNRKKNEAYDQITAVSVAWATPKTTDVKKAEQAIDDRVWQLLQSHLDKVAEVRDTKNDLMPISAKNRD